MAGKGATLSHASLSPSPIALSVLHKQPTMDFTRSTASTFDQSALHGWHLYNPETRTKTIGFKIRGAVYTPRSAVRTILKNAHGEIIIMYAAAGDYYKLPGGGIDATDESHQAAVTREAREETGCVVDVGDELIATVVEYRDRLCQTSYCYYAEYVADTKITRLRNDEVADGLRHEWVSVEEAIGKMEASRPKRSLGKFIKERDLFLLKVYAKDPFLIGGV